MKTKYVYITTAILCIFVLLVIFKLNDYYKTEKLQSVSNQMSQQNLSLKTSISIQLGQLKNILSTYSVRMDESKLNWMQMDPMTVMAQTHISKAGQFEVKNIFTKSGSKTERWTKDFLQKALALRKYSGRAIHADLFQTAAGDKYLALSFVGASSASGSDAVTVVGDANYFQKFFDLNRSKKITHLVMTSANVVAGHSESEYVASITAEGELNSKNYFTEAEELRSSNLKIISYVSRAQVLSFINIPFMLLGLILGFSCVLVGILFYAFRPIEKTLQAQKTAAREIVYQETVQKALSENQRSIEVRAPSVEFKVPDLVVQNIVTEKPKLPPVKITDTVSTAEPDLNSTIESAVNSVASRAASEGVCIHKELNAKNKFNFEQVRFQKMFEHILKNAIEAVELSSTKNIFVRTMDQDSETIIEIQDSGTGISEDHLEKIWQPYFSTKEKNRHQGLGLSESLSVARRYGADLTIKNNQNGVGAIVRLTMNNLENVVRASPDQKTADEFEVTKKIDEFDLDRILNFDDDGPVADISKPTLDLKKEFTTTQFKIDRHIEIIEEPQIQFQKTEKNADRFKVQIRGPQKS